VHSDPDHLEALLTCQLEAVQQQELSECLEGTSIRKLGSLSVIASKEHVLTQQQAFLAKSSHHHMVSKSFHYHHVSFASSPGFPRLTCADPWL
jgi:hypothetical protein